MKTKTRLILLAPIALALVASSLKAITIPQLALGGGYECVLIVHNHRPATWDGVASLLTGNELFWEGTWAVQGATKNQSSGFAVHLASGATGKYTLTGDSQARAGYLVLLPDQGGSEQGIEVTFFYNLKSGEQLVDSTGVPVLPPASHFVLAVEKTATVSTAFAWAPMCIKNSFNIRLRLFNSAGSLLQTVDRYFDGHNAQFFDQAFTNVPTPFLGRMEVLSDELLYMASLRLETPPGTIQLTSSPPAIPLVLESIAFQHRDTLPLEFSCEGQSVSPPVNWKGDPPGTQSWALIMEDPDASGGTFVHWVLYAIPAATRFTNRSQVPAYCKQGHNSSGASGYAAACPPAGERHRYFFKLYALDNTPALAAGATAAQLRQAMDGHILSTAQFMAFFR